jgi:signal transduction histidine kinase
MQDCSTIIRAMPATPDNTVEKQQPTQHSRVASRAIVLLNLDGHIVSANGLAIKALGVEESSFLGQPLGNLFEKPTAARLKQYYDRALKGSAVKCQVRLKSSSGSMSAKNDRPLLNVRIRLHIVGANCSLEATWETQEPGRDPVAASPQSQATARQGAFETLFQAYLELQEINKQKTSMLAAATHELKTPLTVMNGSCELLLGGSLGELNPGQREIVLLSHQNVRRLWNVVNSFLDFSAVERGKLLLVFEKHSPSDIVAESARYWKRLGQSRGIQVDFAVARDLPMVSCDRAKLQNVLNSLCDNALKYTPKGGQITLVADLHFWERRLASVTVPTERRERADEDENANGIRFTVTDSGQGIPSEYHQEIFEEYFQVPGSVAGGTGLGLSIARKIVTAHKGKIWVESRLGQGTAFHFVLPL